MANTGNDCPRFAGLLAYLGVCTLPPVDSPLTVGVVLPVESLLVGARGLSVALPPKFEPRRGGGDPPSPWLKRRPTVSRGLLALRSLALPPVLLQSMYIVGQTGQRVQRQLALCYEIRVSAYTLHG